MRYQTDALSLWGSALRPAGTRANLPCMVDSLTDALNAIRDKAPATSVAFYDAHARRLAEAGVGAGALKVGDLLPDFALPDTGGRLVRSGELVARAPLVVSFYRGGWCPYCRTELDALQAALPAIRGAGGTLVAVTAEAGGRADATRRAHGLDFDILVDIDHGLALACGLLFPLKSDEQAYYLRHDIALSRIHGNAAWFLALPATYVVGRDGVVQAGFVETDPRRRMEPADVVAAVGAAR